MLINHMISWERCTRLTHELTGCDDCESDENVLSVAELVEMPECSRQHAVEQSEAQAGVRKQCNHQLHLAFTQQVDCAFCKEKWSEKLAIRNQEIEIFRQEISLVLRQIISLDIIRRTKLLKWAWGWRNYKNFFRLFDLDDTRLLFSRVDIFNY